MKAKLVLLLVIMAVLSSCYYDNEEELYNCSVDAANTKFSTSINSILTSYGCKGCHNGASSSAGINLETYAGVKAVVDNGKLVGAVNHSQGFVPMPQGGVKMNGCDIKKIQAWISSGAANN